MELITNTPTHHNKLDILYIISQYGQLKREYLITYLITAIDKQSEHNVIKYIER